MRIITLLSCILVYTFGIHSLNLLAQPKKIYYASPACACYTQLVKCLTMEGYEVNWINNMQELDKLKNEDYDYLICHDLTSFTPFIVNDPIKFPKHKNILILWEPPTVIPDNQNKKYHEQFAKVLTWCDDLVDNIKYIKFYYPFNIWYLLNKYANDEDMSFVEPVNFDQKKLCVLINTYSHDLYASKNPLSIYAERAKIAEYFDKTNTMDFDLFGANWPSQYKKNYHGPVNDKLNTLRNYKFCICYENTINSGYVSEKILECFRGQCVPVYWGATNIEKYIPTDCFIDRRNFKDNEELVTFLRTITKEQYQKYLENIYNYVKNDPRVQFFTWKNLAKTLIEHCFT